VRDYGQNDGFKICIDKFMATTYTLIHNEHPPRIFSKCIIFLQCNPKLKYGDWYIFEDYTILRIYGLELKPYKLPIFLTPRVFSFEYIRQRIYSSYIHFASINKKYSLMSLAKVFSYIVKTRATFDIVEKMMKYFHFEEDTFWQYDPCHLISNMRIAASYVPYIHHAYIETKRI